MHLTIEKAGAFTALKKAIRDIRLVPETIKDHTAAYNVHDTAAGNPGVPSASVVVHRNKKGKAQVTMDAEPNALGVRGLRAVSRMIGKMHPEIKRFSVNRPKAAERAAFQQDFPKTHEGMTQEERLNVYDEVDAMIDNSREQAKTSMQARGISTRQQVRHNNPFAKALTLVKANIVMASPQLGKMGKLFDYESLGKENTPAQQGHIERVPIVTSVAAKNYDQIVGQTTRTLRSKENQKLLDEGMKHHGHLWYHLDPLHNAFKERLGEEEGSRRFNLFARTVAATSPNSEFTANMRRAGALMPFMVHGDSKKVLTADEGINHLVGPKQGNTAHRNYASALQATREGKASIFSRPLKADSFAANLQGNFSPLTADRHFLRQAGMMRADGEAKQSASPTEYQAVEDATHHVAAGLARRGVLPVSKDRGATAPFQAALWIGDAVRGRVKSPPHPALAVFEQEITRTAGKLRIHPKEALNRFIDGSLHHFGGGAPGLEAHLRVQKSTDSPFAKAFALVA